MKKRIKTFVVKRSGWLRGDNAGGSALRMNNGKQCCLGYVARQCNIRAKDIMDKALPASLSDKLYLKFPPIGNSEWEKFAHINDDEEITDKEREKQLKALAKENGFRFKFVP